MLSSTKHQISESDLEAWSKRPSDSEEARCENAEDVISNALENSDRLKGLDFEVFGHGSYKSNTNIRLDSDVDICVCLKTTFNYTLPPNRTKEEFGISDATMIYSEFRRLVDESLHDRFDPGVTEGSKATDVHANSYRVDADVLTAFEYREYTGIIGGIPQLESGIQFVTRKGESIINWPKQWHLHSMAKDNRTGNKYRRVVRILKRLRNDMQKNGITLPREIPSCLIASLVWNVPDSAFAYSTWKEVLTMVLTHIFNGTRTDQACAGWTEVNAKKLLFSTLQPVPGQPWTRGDAAAFAWAAWIYLGLS